MRFAQLTNESIDDNGTLGATEDAIKAAETGTDVAEGNADVIKDVNEINSTDMAIEDAFAAQDEVEALLEAAEETQAEGGMSEREAKLMDISNEAIMSKLGMSARQGLSKSPISTLESFSSTQTRMSATVYTIETLKENASALGQKIISALKAALNSVMSFLSALTRNRAVLERHLKNLQKQVTALKDETKKKDKISSGAAALSVNGSASVATAGQILDGAEKLISASATISTAIKDKVGKGEATGTIKSAVESLTHLTHGRTVEVKEADGIVTAVINSGKTAESIDAPTKAEMSNLLQRALTVLGKLREFDKTQTKLKDAVSNIIDLLKEGYNKARSMAGKADNQVAAARKDARQARGMMSKAGGAFPGAAFQAIKAVADYVAGGIRNLGGKAEAAPAGASAPESK